MFFLRGRKFWVLFIWKNMFDWDVVSIGNDVDVNVINYNIVLLFNNYIIYGVLCKFISIKFVY